jgi:hypothetical protein
MRTYEGWRYVDLNGQLYVQAALFPGKEPLVLS